MFQKFSLLFTATSTTFTDRDDRAISSDTELPEKNQSAFAVQWPFNGDLTRVQPSYFDQRLQPRGVDATPWILVFPPNFFVKFFMGIVSGSRNPMVMLKFSISIT